MKVSSLRSVFRVQIADAVSRRTFSATSAACQRRGGDNTDDTAPFRPIHPQKPGHQSSPHFGKHGRGGGSKWSDRKIEGAGGRKLQPPSVSSLFTPVPVAPNPDDINVGAELTDKLKKQDLMKILTTFAQREPVKALSREHGLDSSLYHQAYISFRRFCLDSETLPADLHIVFSDILQGAGHPDDLYPYFLQHAKKVFPHLECMDELKKISDLRSPANWYSEARALGRKIIFHAGPTNSGKTFHALERFLQAKSGVYCGPLKLLAVEGFRKANDRGTPCDLVTGEERAFASPDGVPAAHVSCTVEMSSVSTPYEVAVIDEIQMLRDRQRGWAWTRALLGVAAEEVHVCGEDTAIDLVREICATAGEEVEVRKYKRLTELTVENEALRTLERVQPGDAIVCFSKNDIYAVSRQIERLGREVAVIYGGLPPGTKLAQAAKFNDPDDPCKILVATDAIGMGLNLSIRRVIFYSLMKPTLNERGEKEMDIISVSSALQIAGRAGRFGTQFEKGYVTTFKQEDLSTLKELLASPPEEIPQAGLHPTAEQIELYAYHLPHASLSNLMDIFVSLSTVDDSLYFICNVEDFKFLADMIQHVPLPLRARYVFCCAPINKKMAFVCTMFLKFARQYSRNEAITLDWLCHHIGWPLQAPKTIIDLVHLESVFDVLDLYLWLSYRFQDLFPDVDLVRDMQKELDLVIQAGVLSITRLLRNSETKISSRTGSLSASEDSFTLKPKVRPSRKARPEEFDADYDGVAVPAKEIKNSKSTLVNLGGGKLTERLLKQGLLTEEMIAEMQREWRESRSRDGSRVQNLPDEEPVDGKE